MLCLTVFQVSLSGLISQFQLHQSSYNSYSEQISMLTTRPEHIGSQRFNGLTILEFTFLDCKILMLSITSIRVVKLMWCKKYYISLKCSWMYKYSNTVLNQWSHCHSTTGQMSHNCTTIQLYLLFSHEQCLCCKHKWKKKTKLYSKNHCLY